MISARAYRRQFWPFQHRQAPGTGSFKSLMSFAPVKARIQRRLVQSLLRYTYAMMLASKDSPTRVFLHQKGTVAEQLNVPPARGRDAQRLCQARRSENPRKSASGVLGNDAPPRESPSVWVTEILVCSPSRSVERPIKVKNAPGIPRPCRSHNKSA